MKVTLFTTVMLLTFHLAWGTEDGNPKNNDKPTNNTSILVRSPNGRPTFIMGELGSVKEEGFRGDAALKTSTRWTLKTILVNNLGATGKEEVTPSSRRTSPDERGNSHIRFTEQIHGIEVEGAALVMHMDKDGNVFALNGEFVPEDDIPEKPKLSCDSALAVALEQSGIKQGNWLTDCEISIVYGQDGNGYLAWKRTIEYALESRTMKHASAQKDVLFASAISGDLVARHPKVHNARSLETYDCDGNTDLSKCTLISSSPNGIDTDDDAVDAAHNYAIATYDFYFNEYDRDGIDNNGMIIKSYIHYNKSYSGAYWDDLRKVMIYGNGDGESPSVCNCCLLISLS